MARNVALDPPPPGFILEDDLPQGGAQAAQALEPPPPGFVLEGDVGAAAPSLMRNGASSS